MTTVEDDDDDVALGIAAVAPSTLDAASAAAAMMSLRHMQPSTMIQTSNATTTLALTGCVR
eukprot:5840084-Prymnesium_polylepis.1